MIPEFKSPVPATPASVTATPTQSGTGEENSAAQERLNAWPHGPIVQHMGNGAGDGNRGVRRPPPQPRPRQPPRTPQRPPRNPGPRRTVAPSMPTGETLLA